jgi:acetyl esterase/lipase
MVTRMTLALIAPVVALPAYAADPVELSAFIALPRPTPTFELRYGPAPSQAIDVFLPAGSGPHPVAILIHGGCWSMRTAGREQLRQIGAELARHGIAVWSIGYRRADEPGGGYPGTFLDVGVAIDRLRAEAPQYHLDQARTVLVGQTPRAGIWHFGRSFVASFQLTAGSISRIALCPTLSHQSCRNR